jgi:hypothetical protein
MSNGREILVQRREGADLVNSKKEKRLIKNSNYHSKK